MKFTVRTWVVGSLCVLVFSCSPAKYTSLDVSSEASQGVAPSQIPDQSEDCCNSGGDSAPAPLPPSDLISGIPDIDRETGSLIDDISKADPEFNASDVYSLKFGFLSGLFGKSLQKSYLENICKLDVKWKAVIFSGSKTIILDENKCAGFQRAQQVAAANGGACTPQVGTQKQFKFGNIIHFNRSTELGEDCICYRRYDVFLLNGALLKKEVRAFADSETCAAEFAEYKQKL